MRFRKLTAAALAALAAAGLTACDSSAGAAAVVGGHRISDSEVASYVRPGATPYPDANSGEQIVPKSYALQTLIDTELIDRAVRANGGAASTADLSSGKQVFLQGAHDTDVEKYYSHLGYTSAFSELLIKEQSLLQVLGHRVHSDRTGAGILAALHKADVPVSVSSRYGAWDPKYYRVLTTSGAGLPGFVTLHTSAAPTPTPQPTG